MASAKLVAEDETTGKVASTSWWRDCESSPTKSCGTAEDEIGCREHSDKHTAGKGCIETGTRDVKQAADMFGVAKTRKSS